MRETSNQTPERVKIDALVNRCKVLIAQGPISEAFAIRLYANTLGVSLAYAKATLGCAKVSRKGKS